MQATQNEPSITALLTERVKRDVDGTAKTSHTDETEALPLVTDQESNHKVTSQGNMHLPAQDVSHNAPAAQEEDAVITDWELPQTILEPQQPPSLSSQKLELPFQYHPYSELQGKKVPTSHLSPNPKRKDKRQHKPQRKSSTHVHIKSKVSNAQYENSACMHHVL